MNNKKFINYEWTYTKEADYKHKTVTVCAKYTFGKKIKNIGLVFEINHKTVFSIISNYKKHGRINKCILKQHKQNEWTI